MRRAGRFPPPFGTGVHAARPDSGRQKAEYGDAARCRLTTWAALIYLHTENGRDQMIADGTGKLAEAVLKKEDPPASGTHLAREARSLSIA
ncbi:hypothetical protein [Streptosporangium sp. LJ11]|uniref:hypothetical protein n=1 Tax=Streptosporangium sp. LJ11 TaxID=3436927 RepID=UPI003F78B5B1